MKSKKKMLLALGAMSVAAIGAGSVSTFAWFQAANAANIDVTTSNTGTLNAIESTVSITDVAVQLTVVGGSDVELSQDDSGTIYYGAYNNGFFAKTAWNSATDASTHPLVANFTVTAATSPTPTPAQKSALAGKVYELNSTNATFTALGNAALVAADAHAAASPVLKISFGADGTVVTDVNEVSGCTYAVRTNNPDGKEAMKGSAFNATTGDYAVGDYVYESNKVYVCKKAHKNAAWDSSDFELYHDNYETDSTKKTYAAGDVVMGDGTSGTAGIVYICNAATSGAWDSTKWGEAVLHETDGIRITANDVTA